MHAGSVLSLSPSFNLYSPGTEYAEVAAQVNGDFNAKLKLEAFGSEFDEPENEETEVFDEKPRDEPEVEVEEEEEEEGEEDDEFSFACTNPDGSPISADDIFVNGQIRPIFPIFNQDLLFGDNYIGDSRSKEDSLALRPPLRKLFVEERDPSLPSSSSASESDELEQVPSGTYCEWSGGKAVETSPELSKKCNSTWFSKLWRFRDLVHRSNSDGKDAFVFLNHPSANAKPSNETAKKNDKSVKKVSGVENNNKDNQNVKAKPKAKAKAKTTSSSAHERHYVSNRAKREGDKRKSYLPYRQDLVGFFTNVNGLSRNVHPF